MTKCWFAAAPAGRPPGATHRGRRVSDHFSGPLLSDHISLAISVMEPVRHDPGSLRWLSHPVAIQSGPPRTARCEVGESQLVQVAQGHRWFLVLAFSG
jgi:hypothetical protein